MMCSAAMGQPVTWIRIQTKLELIKELYNTNLISLYSYEKELEKLAEEVGIETYTSLGELDNIEKIPF